MAPSPPSEANLPPNVLNTGALYAASLWIFTPPSILSLPPNVLNTAALYAASLWSFSPPYCPLFCLCHPMSWIQERFTQLLCESLLLHLFCLCRPMSWIQQRFMQLLCDPFLLHIVHYFVFATQCPVYRSALRSFFVNLFSSILSFFLIFCVGNYLCHCRCESIPLRIIFHYFVLLTLLFPLWEAAPLRVCIFV